MGILYRIGEVQSEKLSFEHLAKQESSETGRQMLNQRRPNDVSEKLQIVLVVLRE